MDIKNGLEFRYKRYDLYRVDGNNRYIYEENGILTKCLPNILFTSSPVVATFIQLIDLRLIMLFKYIDRLKNFKNIASYK